MVFPGLVQCGVWICSHRVAVVFLGWYSVVYRFAHIEWQWCFLAGTVWCIDLLT